MVRISRIFVFAFLVAVSAGAQILPRPTGWVTDEAQVLPPYVENSLVQKIQAYKDATGVEIAVVTVRSLQGYEIEIFAKQLFNSWGVGQKGRDNGVMLLLAPNERRVRIEVGYGLEGDLTDGQSGYILDRNAVPYFSDNNWSGGLTATVDALLSHLGQKTYQVRLNEKVERERSEAAAQMAEEARRREAEVVRQREQAEFNAAMGTFFSFAVPVAVLIILAGLIYFMVRRRKRLKKLQAENFQAITDAVVKFDDLKLRISEAESVFKSLAAENIDSVRDSLENTLNDVKGFQTVSLTETIPALWDSHSNYRQAEAIREKVADFNAGITDSESKAGKIIGLPELIESKKQWVTSQQERTVYKAQDTQSRYKTVKNRLNEEYDKKISVLLDKAFANISYYQQSLTRSDRKPDWINLGDLLLESESNANQVDELLNEYSGLVARAKADKDNLILELEILCKSGAQTVNHSDVRESTAQSWVSAVVEANAVGQITTDQDQEWVLFLAKAGSSKEGLEEVIRQAKQDVRDAEEQRAQARRRVEEARRDAIRASQRRSSSSMGGGSRRSGSFGGGRSGGGGASRRF